jgi:hypothetical protein
VVFNPERRSIRIRSHFKGAIYTLFKRFFCPTFGETLIEQVRKGGLPPLSQQRGQATLPNLF